MNLLKKKKNHLLSSTLPFNEYAREEFKIAQLEKSEICEVKDELVKKLSSSKIPGLFQI